jgi:cytoskeletal protein CcmA (bactofilin family)
MPQIFNKRADLEARLGPAGSVPRPERPELDAEEPEEEERVEAPSLPVAGLPERAPAPVAQPRTWAEGEGTILAPGTVLEGTLRAAEPVQVAGTLQGTLEAEGPVTIQEGGRLIARVVAPEVVVAGFIDGRVQCHGRLEVRSTGLVKGKLHVGTLRIEEGALLDGQLQMAGAVTAASIEPADSPPAGEVTRSRPGKAARGVDAMLQDALEPLAVNE